MKSVVFFADGRTIEMEIRQAEYDCRYEVPVPVMVGFVSIVLIRPFVMCDIIEGIQCFWENN